MIFEEINQAIQYLYNDMEEYLENIFNAPSTINRIMTHYAIGFDPKEPNKTYIMFGDYSVKEYNINFNPRMRQFSVKKVNKELILTSKNLDLFTNDLFLISDYLNEMYQEKCKLDIKNKKLLSEKIQDYENFVKLADKCKELVMENKRLKQELKKINKE